MYLRWSLSTLYLLACQVSYLRQLRSLLCFCVVSSTINSLMCWFYMSALGFILLQTVKQKLWQTGARTVSVTTAYLRCLSRTDHAPQSVVQLAGTSQLAVTTNRRVQSTQVGQCGSECQSVQHLTQQTDDFGKKTSTTPSPNKQSADDAVCLFTQKKF